MYDDELSGLTDAQLLQRGREAVTPEVQAANSSGSFKLLGHFFTGMHELKFSLLTHEPLLMIRLTFPAIQENASAIAILPTWLQVLGNKIDNSSAIQECPQQKTIQSPFNSPVV